MSSGNRTTTAQAPSVNLVTAKMIDDQRTETTAAVPLISASCAASPGSLSREVVLDHARPGHGEAGEHPDGVQATRSSLWLW